MNYKSVVDFQTGRIFGRNRRVNHNSECKRSSLNIYVLQGKWSFQYTVYVLKKLILAQQAFVLHYHADDILKHYAVSYCLS